MSANVPPSPRFRERRFLEQHVRRTLAFYHPRCIDPAGGFYHYFRDDGEVYDRASRHLVSSARFVFNYAMAARHFGEESYREAAAHGVAYLRDVHRDPRSGGYAWTLKDGRASDATNHCYGLAFVLLAYAKAVEAGLDEARAYLDETYALLERHFWLPEHGLYADEVSADWSERSPYRGQNANMHTCEAMLAAYEASGEAAFLARAQTLAHAVTVTCAAQADGLIWEHYDEHWRIDWDYNRDDPRHLFRPWGFQPGHQTEWAKLLLILDRHAPAGWLAPRAAALFDAALERAWDEEHGGICYGFDPDGAICDGDKYFWVQAESLAAAALLARRTGEQRYWDWYERIWDYAWRHLVDHRYGAWFRILDRANRKYDDLKSPAGKTDYHTMGACYEVMNVVE